MTSPRTANPATEARLAEFRALEARRQAEQYLAFFGRVTSAFALAAGRAMSACPGGLAVDVGCGDGVLSAQLRDHGWRCVAVDLSPAMCAVTAKALGPGSAVAADATALPLRAGAADAVAAAFLLPHLPDLADGLTELRRVLRPGGQLVLTNWAGPAQSPFTGLLGDLLRRLASAEATEVMAERERRTSPQHLRAALLAAGFTDVRFEEQRRTVALASAAEWWEGLARASVGVRHVLRAQPAPVRAVVREEFERAAARYATPAGSLDVPAEALVITARAR